MPNRSDVFDATEEDTQVALRHALERSGYDLESLTEQARTGRFESVKARLAWVAMGDLPGRR
jgi:hypothetical protein